MYINFHSIISNYKTLQLFHNCLSFPQLSVFCPTGRLFPSVRVRARIFQTVQFSLQFIVITFNATCFLNLNSKRLLCHACIVVNTYPPPSIYIYGYIPIRPYKIEIQITTGDESDPPLNRLFKAAWFMQTSRGKMHWLIKPLCLFLIR
jgi:hypothetical protein